MATSRRAGSPDDAKRALLHEVRAQVAILVGFVGLLWGIEVVDAVEFHGDLDRLGIHPRTAQGLLGILCAPFLHGGFAHLMGNTVPLLVLGFFILQRRKRDLLYVSLASALLGGLGIWTFGAEGSVHIGASILVFGYLGFLLSRGIFERRFWSIVGSLVVFALYGSALYGVFPGQVGISWEGHLFGLLGGVLAARRLARPA